MDLIEDPVLEAPNIIIETAVGRIDCDLSGKLEHLEKAITQVATNRAADPDIAAGDAHE